MTALTAVPDRPDTTALSAESAELVQQAQSLVVHDATTYTAAADFGKGGRALQKKIVDFFAPHKERAWAAHKGLCADEAKQLAPIEAAVKIVARKMTDYRAAEERRLEAERREREAQAKKLDDDRRLQEALDAEADGDVAGADQILSEPAPAPFVPVREAAAPKVAGVAATKRWTFELTDFAAVVRHIAGVEKLAHPELLHVLTLNTVSTRQLVVAMKDQFNVPGIRAYQEDGVSFGSE